MESLLGILALVAAVIVISALLSGWVDRTGVPQVAVFLGIGALIGPIGLGLLDASVQSEVLRVVATLSLVLVLFTDAVSLDLREVREHRLLASLVLGPGTILTTALIAGAAWYLLGLSWPLAAIIGAAIASTDPVLLRGLLKRPALHNSVRQALRLESGLNDVVLLPVVLVAIEILSRTTPLTATDWGRLAINMLLLSPGAGIVVGLVGVSALEMVRRKSGVRRDYESLYSLGLAFAAYAAAESAHGSGFIAAFAAGLTISAIDVELCDCFLEYGETTAEMALLFTFVLFGTSIIWGGVAAASGATLAFTVLCLLLRPIAMFPALIPARLSLRDRALISWFGPRGLSTLLLVMLPVFKGIDGSDYLLQVCCLVVLVSVVLHGFSPMLLLRTPEAAPARRQPPASLRAGIALHEVRDDRADAKTITVDEYQQLKASGRAVVLVDSRSERTYDPATAPPDSVRVHPDRAIADAIRHELPAAGTLVVFCA
ncbi:MAG TPA: cation:proton antiporter [Vicinamibacterales bacterium]